MNIKKIIKSQKTRHKLMRLGKFVPDRIMLPLQYKLLLKKWPNLKYPQRFTEWIQWYKMTYRNPVMLNCVDKYSVRDYVKNKIGEEHLVGLLQVCPDASEIQFEKLPNKFVIKTTSGGNGDNVKIVRDKLLANVDDIIQEVNGWLKKDYSDTSREWAYSKASRCPLVLVEEYIENSSTSLDDYKFYCYEGRFRFLSVDKDRYYNHTRAYFNEHLQFLPDIKGNYKKLESAPVLPDNIESMIIIAEELAKEFPFVRVDLYNVKGKIYFGELTFYPASGFSPYTPDTFDFELGKFFPKKSNPIWTEYKKV